MALLWTSTDQQAIKPISANTIGNRFDQIATEVQSVELRMLLGNEFYNDLIQNPTNYTDLINGTTYELNGVTYNVSGLKHVLAYYFYSRYIYDNNDFDTFGGMVHKNFDDSSRLNIGELKNKEKINRQIAGAYWEECKGLIENNISDYPYYKCKNKIFKYKVI